MAPSSFNNKTSKPHVSLTAGWGIEGYRLVLRQSTIGLVRGIPIFQKFFTHFAAVLGKLGAPQHLTAASLKNHKQICKLIKMSKKRAREADGKTADPDKMVDEGESSDDEASLFFLCRA